MLIQKKVSVNTHNAETNERYLVLKWGLKLKVEDKEKTYQSSSEQVPKPRKEKGLNLKRNYIFTWIKSINQTWQETQRIGPKYWKEN